MTQEKVKYGLRNVHYAPLTEAEDGTVTFEQPRKWPGAVSISLPANGDPIDFDADDGTYYHEEVNLGYDGKLETAIIPDLFRTDILGETLVNGVLVENADQKGNKFAILFEFQNDIKARRHVLYYCTASRPEVASNTKGSKTEVQTSTLEFTSRPRPDTRDVKADSKDASSDVYDNWYTSVWEKNSVAVTGITVLPDTVNLAAGEIQQLAVTVMPVNATNKNILYSTSDSAIATVSTSGLVTAVATGTATITAIALDDGSKTDTCVITVA